MYIFIVIAFLYITNAFLYIILQIEVDDSLPKFICTECLENLKNAINFKTTCEASDKKFKKILNPTGFTFYSTLGSISLIESVADKPRNTCMEGSWNYPPVRLIGTKVTPTPMFVCKHKHLHLCLHSWSIVFTCGMKIVATVSFLYNIVILFVI